MIIYGWGFFNRRNYSLTRGQCPHCGSYGYRQSYESTRFATLYFIPVIPLGSQKVTGQCSSCKESMGLSRGKWRKLKRKEMPKVIAEYEADTSHTEKTNELISMLVTCQEPGLLRKYGAEIEATHGSDEKMVGLLALAYSTLCMDEDADRLYLKALDGAPSDDLVEESDLHMRAKDLTKPKPANRWLQSIPVLIVPLVILFLLGRFIGDGISPTLDEATLVNGLSTPYSVRINGTDYSLKGNSYRTIDTIQYGENTLEPISPNAPFEALTFTIDVPLQERMTGEQVVVVNPDQTAVVLWERDEYSVAENGNYSYDLDSGKAYHLYDDIDFFFVAYPEQVQVPSGRNSVFKTRLSTLNEYDDSDRIEALLSNEKLEAGTTFLINKLTHEPNASALLSYASLVVPQDRLMELTQSKVDQVPVLIEYHRYYQRQLEASKPAGTVADEYRERLAAHPGNHALTYLLGRVEEDPATSLELFEAAYSGTGAEGYAANALAYHFLLQGFPEKAQKFADQAIKRDPDNQNFLSLRESIWVANGDHHALDFQAENELKSAPFNVSAFYKKLTAHCMASSSESAQSLIDRFHAKLVKSGGYDRETAQQVRFNLLATVDLLTGDTSAYKMHILKTDTAGTEYIRAVLDGRIDQAREFLERDSLDASGNSHLMLYSLAMLNGNQTLANECLQTANECFANGSKETQQWEKWLTGNQAPEVSQLLNACLDIDHHYAVLIAFAQRFPENRDDYMEHARKICHQKDFTHLAMKDALIL
ncbi:MAG: hypothetical protein ACSHYA_04440 [Opitutaceae bacterium]